MRDLPKLTQGSSWKPTVYERDGKWWWNDEAGQARGPRDTSEDAELSQSMYAAVTLGNGDYNGAGHRPLREWRAAREREPESCTHPCDDFVAWDCMCVGACSCHWEQPASLLAAKDGVDSGAPAVSEPLTVERVRERATEVHASLRNPSGDGCGGWDYSSGYAALASLYADVLRTIAASDRGSLGDLARAALEAEE